MLQTLAITGSIYLVIALGFLGVRFGVFSRTDMRVLGTFVVRFALPALVFTALSLRPELDTTLCRLRESGALGAVVSGSGPTCFGLYTDRAAAANAAAAFEGAIVTGLRTP